MNIQISDLLILDDEKWENVKWEKTRDILEDNLETSISIFPKKGKSQTKILQKEEIRCV